MIQIVVAIALLFLLEGLWYTCLGFYVTVRYREEYRKASLAVSERRPYRGKVFSSILAGLDMTACGGKLSECLPVYRLYTQEVYILGKWWKL